MWLLRTGVQRDRLVVGLTFVFAAMTATVVLVAVAAVEPVLFVVAIPLAAATVVFWYHSSGRLRERVLRMRAEQAAGDGTTGGQGRGGGRASGGGFGAGARREARRDRRRRQRAGRERAGGRRTGERAASGVPPAEAYRRLGLEPDADEDAIRAAYRRKVKEVHPDRGGDEDEFRRVTDAYETLLE